jgi:UDP-N-acetylglucosamine 2-epimerase (non-hydrolysing)
MPSLPEVHLIAGTPAEAIKIAPVVTAMRAAGRVTPVLIASGRHPATVAQALAAFDLEPDVVLPLSSRTGSRPELTTAMIGRLDELFAGRIPRAVVVHGDTTTTLAGALAAFWRRIPVVHLEAGLRSGDLESPFPEEGNRRLVGQLAVLHLAPTPLAATNLLDEGVPANRVVVTGNTVVDAALTAVGRKPQLDAELEAFAGAGRLVLVTADRRESWGEPLERVLAAVRTLLNHYPDLHVVLPSHPSPAVRAQVEAGLAGQPRAVVTGPLPYPARARLLSDAYLVLTDSGSVQEEAPSFGVPALVLREVTERVESLAAGCARLVGTDPALIVAEAMRLLDDRAARDAMTAAGNPYGDGTAAERSEAAVAELLGVAGRRRPVLTLVPTAGQ